MAIVRRVEVDMISLGMLVPRCPLDVVDAAVALDMWPLSRASGTTAVSAGQEWRLWGGNTGSSTSWSRHSPRSPCLR